MIREIPNPYETESGCFFCGPQNEQGLKLVFKHDDEAEEVFVDYVPEVRFQGAGHILHGGMQMGLLDEVMWWACLALAGAPESVTVTATCKFLRPVYIGKTVRISCKLKERDGDSIKLRAKIVNQDGKLCTRMDGEYRVLGPEHFERILSS